MMEKQRRHHCHGCGRMEAGRIEKGSVANGIHNIETRLITGKVIKRLRASADVVLLDVPCPDWVYCAGILMPNGSCRQKP